MSPRCPTRSNERLLTFNFGAVRDALLNLHEVHIKICVFMYSGDQRRPIQISWQGINYQLTSKNAASKSAQRCRVGTVEEAVAQCVVLLEVWDEQCGYVPYE